jgi:hypothetical protein
MGFALPSGVVNMNSAYFYAMPSMNFGVLVKEPTDQTLVVLDYSSVGSAQSYNFTVDVSSNPVLVVSYPKLDATGTVLTFLLSGGIAGQQYVLSIHTMFAGQPRNDVLTVNVPSSQGSCVAINPVPALYTQLPLSTQGYVNTGVRYFWGSAPPANPTVMDQWFNPTNKTLSEYTTDGTNFSWVVLTSTGLVTEAPVTNIIYGRYNGNWVAEPIQADALANGQLYSRSNNAWTLNQIQTDAPSDGLIYGRTLGSWIVVPTAAIPSDAPSNGNAYMRVNGAWSSGGVLTGPLVLSADPTSNLQAATKQYVDNKAGTATPLRDGVAAVGVATLWSRQDHVHPSDTSRLPLSGGTMTGPLILAADPTVALGAATMQYVDNNLATPTNMTLDMGTF